MEFGKGQNMSKSNQKRENLTVRLQPFEDTLDAQILHYIKRDGVKQQNQKVWQALRMAYAAIAYLEGGNLTAQQLRQLGLDNFNALLQHAYYVRQSLLLPETPQILIEDKSQTEDYVKSSQEVEHKQEIAQSEQTLLEKQSGELF
ncbi:hypothetical protein PL9631_940027 [Planktothrix paucivesiculata PCC 9631]|uniref:Uncharacterized protein n=2 Tax=Planktothrix TaxID=54304 RepID=A0A7Z9BYN7_9CYAN|nr:hypothetical protein PL9631_940027 [Planktothrix paucivesiculata PCC 9631]